MDGVVMKNIHACGLTGATMGIANSLSLGIKSRDINALDL